MADDGFGLAALVVRRSRRHTTHLRNVGLCQELSRPRSSKPAGGTELCRCGLGAQPKTARRLDDPHPCTEKYFEVDRNSSCVARLTPSCYFDETRNSSEPARIPWQTRTLEDLPGARTRGRGRPRLRRPSGEGQARGVDPVASHPSSSGSGTSVAGAPSYHSHLPGELPGDEQAHRLPRGRVLRRCSLRE